MTDTAPMPDAQTAPIGEIMAARSSGAINSIAWGTTYAKVIENRLLADSGMPARAASERINMQSIPTAADEGHVIATNPGQVYRDGFAFEQGLRAQVETENAAASASKFDAITAAAYAPAKGPGDYDVPINHNPTDADLAASTAIRQALHAAELPVITAKAVTQAFDATMRQFEHAEPAQLQAFGNREGQALQQLWGPQFADRVKLVDAYLDQLGDKVPLVARLLADPRARFYFADRRVVNALSQMIEGRASQISRATT
jgi:hypothetical protein